MIRALRDRRALPEERRARADRAARVVLPLGGLPRGRARVRGEAQAALARAVGRTRGVLCPIRRLPSRSVPPLITREEALRLGEIEDHAEIEALVERAWKARVERFGDSTDMCSLVNAKSGGCAEDCGFCAQSRFAEADTPMHAMMAPEQILEHARAAEAAGAHRFCMVTQGQGLSKRDFENVLEGAQLVAEHTNLKRCASIGHMSVERAKAAQGGRHPARAPQRRDRRELLPRGLHDRPLRGPAAHDRRRSRRRGSRPASAASSTSASRASSASRWPSSWPSIDPTSVPINLLNPRPGTKFGDRELHGPVGGGEVDRDLPADPARGAVPPLRRARSRTSASCSRSPSRPASTA